MNYLCLRVNTNTLHLWGIVTHLRMMDAVFAVLKSRTHCPLVLYKKMLRLVLFYSLSLSLWYFFFFNVTQEYVTLWRKMRSLCSFPSGTQLTTQWMTHAAAPLKSSMIPFHVKIWFVILFLLSKPSCLAKYSRFIYMSLTCRAEGFRQLPANHRCGIFSFFLSVRLASFFQSVFLSVDCH